MTEEWRACKDFPNYEISSQGRVRRVVVTQGGPLRILKPWNSHGYLAVDLHRDGKPIKRYIHRLYGEAFLDLQPDQQIDHKFHDRADLTQVRVATPAQNIQNGRGQKHSSRYKGVCWEHARQRWCAYIRIGRGRSKLLGQYINEIDAARAYDRAALQAWGEFAFLNLEARE